MGLFTTVWQCHLGVMCPVSLSRVCVCNDVCVCVCKGGVPQCPVSHYPRTFMSSCLSHAADTIVTDSSCCAKRKAAFEIRAFQSNYYFSVWAWAQLRHSITLPLMEENLWAIELARPRRVLADTRRAGFGRAALAHVSCHLLRIVSSGDRAVVLGLIWT